MSIQLAVQDKVGPMFYADGAIFHRLFLFGPMVPNSSVSTDAWADKEKGTCPSRTDKPPGRRPTSTTVSASNPRT